MNLFAVKMRMRNSKEEHKMKKLSDNGKRAIENSLRGIAIVKAIEKYEGVDMVEIDEFIAERGKAIFEEFENMTPRKLAIKIMEEVLPDLEEMESEEINE